MNPEMVNSGSVMPEWLKKRALLSPNRLALVHGSLRLSFGELELWSGMEAKRLARLGVRAGNRVAVLSPNTLGFVLAVHALPKLRAILVPLNTRLAGPELAWQLADVGASFLLYDGSFKGRAFWLAQEVLGLQTLPLLEGFEGRLEAFEWVHQEGLRTSQTHSILYTSGTTGQPKGAMLTFGNHLFSALGSWLNLGLNEEDRWLLSLPLFHVGGLSILLRCVILGIPAIIPEGLDSEALNRAIDEEEVTLASLVAATL
jgi:O-succinylbenzoic acid--CoA ligase